VIKESPEKILHFGFETRKEAEMGEHVLAEINYVEKMRTGSRNLDFSFER